MYPRIIEIEINVISPKGGDEIRIRLTKYGNPEAVLPELAALATCRVLDALTAKTEAS